MQEDHEKLMAQREAEEEIRIREQLKAIRAKDNKIPKEKSKLLAYLMCKNRATEALDRKQTELKALNNELEIQVKSQAGENELTKGLI